MVPPPPCGVAQQPPADRCRPPAWRTWSSVDSSGPRACRTPVHMRICISSPCTHASTVHIRMYPQSLYAYIPSLCTHASPVRVHMHPQSVYACIPSPCTHAFPVRVPMHPQSVHACIPSPCTHAFPVRVRMHPQSVCAPPPAWRAKIPAIFAGLRARHTPVPIHAFAC